MDNREFPSRYYWHKTDAQWQKHAPLIGKGMPELHLADWRNGDAKLLTEFTNKIVVLEFWATWCATCLAAIPHNQELIDKFGDQGLVIIGVCAKRGGEKMAETAKQKGIEYPIALDAESKTDASYGVDGYPDYYFIDRQGNLRIADCKNANVDEAIALLLAEKAK